MNSTIKTLFTLTSIISLSSLLGGCAFTNDVTIAHSDSFKLSEQSTNGLLALPLGCNIRQGNLTLFLARDLLINQQSAHDSNVYSINTKCQEIGSPVDNPQLIYADLPPGYYRIYNYHLDTPYGFSTAKIFYPIIFLIKPQKINYIGELKLLAGYNNRIVESISDKSVRDFPRINKNLVNGRLPVYKKIAGIFK